MSESTDPALPLAGVKVLDLTRALAGPYCTALLGDFGAEIIKVEGLPEGDATRAWPPFDGDRSLYFLSTNRNKRSIALDLRSPEARQILQDLVAESDVLVENFRPGVLAKMGLDPARLEVERPDLVIASISGFGEVGPMRHDAGLDQVAQGMSGMMSVTGAGENTPMRVGVPITDMAAGMFLSFGIASSLAGRATTGRAVRVSTSLLEGAIALMSFQAQRFLSAGEVPQPQGNDHPIISPYGTFQAADASINVAVGNGAQWQVLCRILGDDGLATHESYAAAEQRAANRPALYARLNELFGRRTAAEWLRELRAAGVPAGPIYAMDEVFADAQVQALGMVQSVESGVNRDNLLRGPLSLGGMATKIHRSPPALGQHSVEILAELGYTDQQISELAELAVIPAGEGQPGLTAADVGREAPLPSSLL